MPEHIEAYDNLNQPIVDTDNDMVPLCYFNQVRLAKGESHSYTLPEHESCVVPVTGTCDIEVDGETFKHVGEREHLWDKVPNAVYVPVSGACTITATSDIELFIAGGRFDEKLKAFAIRSDDVDIVQYGSDDTKTHRKIKHILGQSNADKRGRLLVSELFTVGQGGWSGFPPHKHDTENPPQETRYEEVYQFRFNPPEGFAAQFAYMEDGGTGPCHHVRHGSSFKIDKGYHPSVVAPGYEMYYFTIIVGEHSKSLVQNFEPTHEHQVQTIPGIKDMIARFK